MAGSFGSGSAGISWSTATPAPFLSFAPCTVTKDGQNPLIQEKSLLELDSSLARFRPPRGSNGSTGPPFDGPLPAPRGLQRLHRHAFRLHPAIAAAFADEFIDNDALFGVGISVALAAAALFGGACLVVDQHSNFRYFRKLFLHLNQFVAMMNGKPAWPLRVARVLVRLVGDHNDTLGALGSHLTSDLRNRKAAVVCLAAGHRHRIVEQDLVGDVGFGRDGGADRHIAGMVVGAVAEILKNMLALGEWRS